MSPIAEVGRRGEGSSPLSLVFEENLALVDQVLRFVARRYHARADEAEDFASIAKLRLIEDDYAILRKFGGRSSLKTYLTTVLLRLFLDYRTEKWGKWRPSAVARRLGPAATSLERLITRDHVSTQQACEQLAQQRVFESPAAAREVAEKLPPRTSRRIEGEETLARVTVSEGIAEGPAVLHEAEQAAGEVEDALAAALAGHSAEDRLILRLKFEQGSTVGEIARLLHLEEKPLYRRIERLLGALRVSLEGHGIEAARLRELLEVEGLDWSGRVFRETEDDHRGETARAGPSKSFGDC